LRSQSCSSADCVTMAHVVISCSRSCRKGHPASGSRDSPASIAATRRPAPGVRPVSGSRGVATAARWFRRVFPDSPGPAVIPATVNRNADVAAQSLQRLSATKPFPGCHGGHPPVIRLCLQCLQASHWSARLPISSGRRWFGVRAGCHAGGIKPSLHKVITNATNSRASPDEVFDVPIPVRSPRSFFPEENSNAAMLPWHDGNDQGMALDLVSDDVDRPGLGTG
jgi:hypothetical protein